MTEAELRAVEERAAAATLGPWELLRNTAINPHTDAFGWVVVGGNIIVAECPRPSGHLDTALADLTLLASCRQDVPALCDEVRACWAAINDLRQDSAVYRRAIVDAVKVILSHADTLHHLRLKNMQEVAEKVADLALTHDEFVRVWAGEPAPLGVVYDADDGFCGRCVDVETGEEIRYVKRANPEAGWYESFDLDERGELSVPPALRRHWRNIKVYSYDREVTA